jgi:hypothetical protein
MFEFMQSLLHIGQTGGSESSLWVLFVALVMGAGAILGRMPRN